MESMAEKYGGKYGDLCGHVVTLYGGPRLGQPASLRTFNRFLILPKGAY